MQRADSPCAARAFAAGPGAASKPAWRSGPETTVDIYDDVIPPFVEASLDRLYCSIYSTLDQFRIDNALSGTHTYVARTGGEITAVLLYRIEGGVARVLNQMVAIDGAALACFARAIFKRYGSVSAISFRPVRTDMRGFPYPFQQHHCAEDIVAVLPETNVEYAAALGKNMRETVRRHGNKIRRAFPAYRFEVYTDGEIDPGQAMAVYRMHMARMDRKRNVSHLDEQRFCNIVALARARGMMTLASIDGRICGGLICWRTGAHYVMRVIAHDPDYDEYKIGTVCCYETIRECIARGATHFHFGGGRMLYKYRLLGTNQLFDDVLIYRSRAAFLCHPVLAARTAFNGAKLDLSFWLQDAEGSDDAAARAALALRQHWRSARTMARKLLARQVPAS